MNIGAPSSRCPLVMQTRWPIFALSLGIHLSQAVSSRRGTLPRRDKVQPPPRGARPSDSRFRSSCGNVTAPFALGVLVYLLRSVVRRRGSVTAGPRSYGVEADP